MSFINKRAVLAIFLLTAAFCSFATVTLPHILSNNMVLKQKSASNLWGTAAPGAKMVIFTSWDKKNYSVAVAADGKGSNRY